MKTILLVRHGHTEARPRSFCGSTDVQLSSRGRRQSMECVRVLLDHKVQLVVTTGLRRTDYVGLHMSRCGIPHQVEPMLQEVDFGAWEGKTWEEIQATHPVQARQWLDAPTAMRFPAGEAMPAFIDRLQAAWERILQQPEEVVAIVAHSAVLGHIVQHVRGDDTPPYIDHGQFVQLIVN